MPYVKTLVRSGNSTSLVIDKAILKQLDLEPGAEVELTVERNALVVRAASTHQAEPADVKASAHRMIARHGKSLDKLGR